MAKHGWEEGAGWGSFARQGADGPTPAALESGSLTSGKRETGVEVENKEHSAP